ncbi:hypothetical protein Taro_047349 [Colocasia esculenta]|uniref:Uncharacterized protein n=1 Tax=Colocasia esculenta TaxID=4460 RepID=A0A843X7W6_COLES|nr:hypothetical protein [Colocasia esculenta]
MLPSSMGISPSKLFLNRFLLDLTRFAAAYALSICIFEVCSRVFAGSKELVVWWPAIGVLGRGGRKSVLKSADCSPSSKLFDQAWPAQISCLCCVKTTER